MTGFDLARGNSLVRLYTDQFSCGFRGSQTLLCVNHCSHLNMLITTHEAPRMSTHTHLEDAIIEIALQEM